MIPSGVYREEKLNELQDHVLMTENFFEWLILPHLWNKLIETINEQISKIAQNYPTIFKIASNVEPVLMC